MSVANSVHPGLEEPWRKVSHGVGNKTVVVDYMTTQYVNNALVEGDLCSSGNLRDDSVVVFNEDAALCRISLGSFHVPEVYVGRFHTRKEFNYGSSMEGVPHNRSSHELHC